MIPVLEVRDLVVTVDGKKVVDGVSFAIQEGELHIIMGPNGAGKSSIGKAIMGDPDYLVEGDILYKGTSVVHLSLEERVHLGLFTSFQHPVALPGVRVPVFLAAMVRARHGCSEQEAQEQVTKTLEKFHVRAWSDRDVNVGFSGGEKKKLEVIQMSLLNPSFVTLDELDSGLDRDALHMLSAELRFWLAAGGHGMLAITHYTKLLDHMKPAVLHIMMNGRFVRSGDHRLIDEVESVGYAGLL